MFASVKLGGQGFRWAAPEELRLRLPCCAVGASPPSTKTGLRHVQGFDTRNGERVAFSTDIYSESEIKRIAHVAFRAAQKRSGRLCSVDKANVLEVSQLWRQVVTEVGAQYPDVELSHMCAVVLA